MSRIGVTQRVEVVPEYGERRDCLDQEWTTLLADVGHDPVPLPNTVTAPGDYLADLDIEGLVLTGGNDLAHLPDAESAAPERDAFETDAIEYAIDTGLPVLGVCRGMQLLNHYFGGEVDHVNDHVARDHDLAFERTTTSPGLDVASLDAVPADGTVTVNSYHGYGIWPGDVADPFVPLATAPDGSIECFIHPAAPIVGIMWHPERESPADRFGRELVASVLGGSE